MINKIKEVGILYSEIEIYDENTGEKLGSYIEIPFEQLN